MNPRATTLYFEKKTMLALWGSFAFTPILKSKYNFALLYLTLYFLLDQMKSEFTAAPFTEAPGFEPLF